MPSKDEEPHEEPRAAKKLTMRRYVSETGMVRIRANCRKSNNSFSPGIVIYFMTNRNNMFLTVLFLLLLKFAHILSTTYSIYVWRQ